MMRGAIIVLITAGALALVALRVAAPPPARVAVANILTDANPPPGFAYATAVREFTFPQDHAAHPDYRTEWWYFTGNLVDDNQREFGFQLTLFRYALAANTTPTRSPWRAADVYLAHFAISDIGASRFHAFERRARPALDRAGVTTAPVALWLDDWRIERAPGARERWRLSAADAGLALDLHLEARSPIVLQGDRGLSQKSAEPGNASYYYSIPRLAATGELTIAGEALSVTGAAWFDHEWSTSALAEDQLGWDWFSLQLDDGSDVMFYRLRNRGQRADPVSHGIVRRPGARPRVLKPADVRLRVSRHWRSPASGARYPAHWRLDIPNEGLSLDIEPRFAAQEWHGSVTYWEGAVAVFGTSAGTPVAGKGYVELVGY